MTEENDRELVEKVSRAFTSDEAVEYVTAYRLSIQAAVRDTEVCEDLKDYLLNQAGWMTPEQAEKFWVGYKEKLLAPIRALVKEFYEFADTDYTHGMKLGDARKQAQHELMMAGQALAYATAAKKLESALPVESKSAPEPTGDKS